MRKPLNPVHSTEIRDKAKFGITLGKFEIPPYYYYVDVKRWKMEKSFKKIALSTSVNIIELNVFAM